MAKMVIDCENDQKGLHDWKDVGDDNETGKFLYWCHQCGALGRKHPDVPTSKMQVFKRIQE